MPRVRCAINEYFIKLFPISGFLDYRIPALSWQERRVLLHVIIDSREKKAAEAIFCYL